MGAAARWTWARFADLERNDLYDALALRSRVFVVAQRSAALRRAALAEAAERAARRQRVILLIVTMTRSPRRAARQSLDPVPAGAKRRLAEGAERTLPCIGRYMVAAWTGCGDRARKKHPGRPDLSA